MIEKSFEKSLRKKYRFESPQGPLTTEDLWDIPLSLQPNQSATKFACIDNIARGLFNQLKNSEEISFVAKAQKTDEDIQIKFDIVRYIIEVRMAEDEAKAMARVNREKKQQLLSIIAHKENEALLGTSLDELKAMVNTL